MAMEKDCKVVTTLSGTEYIRALAEDGSTVRIPIAELGKVMAQVMPIATSEENGLMSTSVLNSIYNIKKTIQPRGSFDTEIKNGGLIMFQNSGMVHDVAVAVMYSDGRGKVINTAPHVSFFGGSDYIDVRKESPTKSIEIVNNTDNVQHFNLRIICSVI